MMRIIKRKCLMCGQSLRIKLLKNGSHTGGYYFGELEFDVGEGEHVKVGECDFEGLKIDVVEWTGPKKKVEYWECADCYRT